MADAGRLAFVTQTTLSVDETLEIVAALKARFPDPRAQEAGHLRYATQNRQDAVKFMAPQVEVVIVVGSPNSSNSSRLRELAERLGVPAYMIDSPDRAACGVGCGQAPHRADSRRVRTGGALAQSSRRAPCACWEVRNVRALDGIEEKMSFPLPRGLQQVTPA
ncbi:hypothetical protein ACU4GD_45675 [Cupriavidus basilensis]